MNFIVLPIAVIKYAVWKCNNMLTCHICVLLLSSNKLQISWCIHIHNNLLEKPTHCILSKHSSFMNPLSVLIEISCFFSLDSMFTSNHKITSKIQAFNYTINKLKNIINNRINVTKWFRHGFDYSLQQCDQFYSIRSSKHTISKCENINNHTSTTYHLFQHGQDKKLKQQCNNNVKSNSYEKIQCFQIETNHTHNQLYKTCHSPLWTTI